MPLGKAPPAATHRARVGSRREVPDRASDQFLTRPKRLSNLRRLSESSPRLTGLAEDSEGFKLYPELEVLPADIRVKKITYSAMIPDSSNLSRVLAQNCLDTLLITGTATNVCCESTARDASMFNYRVIMLSDGNAAATAEEHAGTLNNFQIFFGDVMTTDEAIARLAPVAARKTA